MKAPRQHPRDARSPAGRPKVRSASIRPGGKDGLTLTPTERRKKNQLMKQFSRAGRKGYEVSSGSSPAFRENYDKIDWDKS